MFTILRILALCLAALPLVLGAKFSAVGLPVSNLAASEAFYTKTLGFKPFRTLRLPEYDETILSLPGSGAAGTALVIMQYKSPRNVTNLPGKLVFNVENMAETMTKFRAAGAKVISEPGSLMVAGKGIPTAFVRDVDGHVIELNPIDFVIPKKM
jgi:catechol 2,3-dioxygenase-like lactoylglutathione lyase family enzyme